MSFTIDRRAVTKAALAIAAISVSGMAAAEERRISGTATYRERIALPPEAQLEVRLIDVTSPEGAPALVANTSVSPAGQVPIAFELSFDDSALGAYRKLALAAQLSASGQILFATADPVAIDRSGLSSQIELRLVRQEGGGRTLPAEIVGTEWHVEEIAGAELNPGTVSTLLLNENGTAGGNAGCNRFFAIVTVSGSALTFSEVGSTFMACADAVMAQESAYLAGLQRVAAFRLDDGKLLLVDAEGDVVVRLGVIA